MFKELIVKFSISISCRSNKLLNCVESKIDIKSFVALVNNT